VIDRICRAVPFLLPEYNRGPGGRAEVFYPLLLSNWPVVPLVSLNDRLGPLLSPAFARAGSDPPQNQ
jgi:hypothetical protein